jgi:gliding-associated putative ABC transporter substrate-binding component GldG
VKNADKALYLNLAILIGILILINLISLNIFHRFDFSKGKVFTLSESSKKTVASLQDNLVIKAYFSKNLPDKYADNARYVKDILSDYQAYSKGKLKFEFIDPSDEEKLKTEASKERIYPARIRVLENDKMEIREVYMGLSFEYQGNFEAFPLVQEKEGLENSITHIVRRLLKTTLPTVAVFQDSLSTEETYKTLNKTLSQNYNVFATDLTRAFQAKVLVFTGVLDSLTILQQFNLDQYLMHGGNILFFQDMIFVYPDYQTVQPIPSNIFRMLRNWGMEMKPALVTDANCGTVKLRTHQGMNAVEIPMNYPLIPIVNNVNRQNIISKNLNTIAFFFASPINTKYQKNGIKVTPLLMTSHNTGQVVGPHFDINIQRFMGKNSESLLSGAPEVLAALYEGTFNSNFPKIDSTKVEGYLSHSNSSKIILVADNDFIVETAGGQIPNNLNFILNSIDYLAGDTSMIEVRSRNFIPNELSISAWIVRKMGIEDPQEIAEREPSIRKLSKWLNIILPSLILVLFGIIRNGTEKKRRREIKERYV